MNLSKPLTTAAIFGTIAFSLIVLHFFGFIGPEPQPIWPFEPVVPFTEQPVEFFTVARGFISGVIWTAVIASITQMIRDAFDGAMKTVIRDYAADALSLVIAKVKGWLVRG